MTRLILFVLLTLAFSVPAFAQAREEEKPIAAEDYVPHRSYINAGFGVGLDYGGVIGTKVNVFPVRWFNVFGSVGVYYDGGAFATGFQFRLPSEGKVEPYITGLYGVNGGIRSNAVYIVSKQYYGYSVGGGIEVKNKNSDKIFWSFGFIIPFQDPQVQRDFAAIKQLGKAVGLYYSDWPVTFSIGFHIRLDMDKGGIWHSKLPGS